jgi:hypothetical protein
MFASTKSDGDYRIFTTTVYYTVVAYDCQQAVRQFVLLFTFFIEGYVNDWFYVFGRDGLDQVSERVQCSFSLDPGPVMISEPDLPGHAIVCGNAQLSMELMFNDAQDRSQSQ